MVIAVEALLSGSQAPVAELVALLLVVLGGLAEQLHHGRVRRVALLAFGPEGRPRPWARLAPALRVLAAASLGWGLCTLLLLPPKVHKGDATLPPDRHLVFVLDVSPSMRLADAGPEGKQTRTARAAEVVRSLMHRLPLERYRTSVVAFYNGAKPVVQETRDLEVVRNVLEDLPMHHAFQKGSTRLADGLVTAAEMIRPWNPKSVLLVVVTDGDSVPGDLPRLPASVGDVLVLGVGDPRAGKFIDGRHSRQDVANLRQVAARLGGTYHDGNQKHLPSSLVGSLAAGGPSSPLLRLSRREYALLAAGLGAALLALLPLGLHRFGSAWSPGVPARGDVEPREGSLAPARPVERTLERSLT